MIKTKRKDIQKDVIAVIDVKDETVLEYIEYDNIYDIGLKVSNAMSTKHWKKKYNKLLTK